MLGFLDSSIETLELSKESDVNGIMSKDELLDRLRERKRIVEKALNNVSLSEDLHMYSVNYYYMFSVF